MLSEYEQIVGYFYSRHGTPAAGTSANSDTEVSSKKQLEKILAEIEDSAANRKTLLITDYRCVEHADFPNKRNIKEKASQRERQPENSDRLALLMDS